MNPWLKIPLEDYEAHMAMPEVGQAQLISDVFADAIQSYSPDSLAVLGCAGGNGLERIPSGSQIRVMAIDINPDYIACARSRYCPALPNATFLTHDLQHAPVPSEAVDLVFAALIFEYVDIDQSLTNMKPLFQPGSVLVAVFQMPTIGKSDITPTPYKSLLALDGHLRLVHPDRFALQARKAGLSAVDKQTMWLPSGKEFTVMHFQTGNAG